MCHVTLSLNADRSRGLWDVRLFPKRAQTANSCSTPIKSVTQMTTVGRTIAELRRPAAVLLIAKEQSAFNRMQVVKLAFLLL